MSDYKDDIEKYLKGELSPSQMNALEKKALSDPFLADALEGAQTLQAQDLQSDLAHLKGTLHKRIRQQDGGVWLWASRIAAGLVVIALSAYVVIWLSEKKDSNLALNKQKELAPAPIVSDSSDRIVDSADKSHDGGERLRAETEQVKEDRGKTAKSAPPAAVEREQPLIADLAEDDAGQDIEINEEADQNAESKKAENSLGGVTDEKIASTPTEPRALSSVPAEPKKSDANDVGKEATRRRAVSGASENTQSSRDKERRKLVRGKVTFSEDGVGLPGVNVIVKGTNQGTVTDLQGQYQIPLSHPDSTLIFSFIGFASEEKKIESDELNVELEADVSELSEVVVVGYGSENISGALPFDSPVMELATPAGGRKVYKQYLEQNIRYPEQAIKNQVEGKVTVQFTIETTGQLSDFRVIRGIGFGCDEEVIRLIKQGPKWAPSKKDEEPVRDKVKVRMRFALPKK